jgi:hypothetical protein
MVSQPLSTSSPVARATPICGGTQSESLSDLPFRQDCKALASQGEGESFFSGGV